MVKTKVGYCGGAHDAPTYRALGDHTESVQLEFVPSIVSFDTLLDMFWANHDGTRCAKTQYASRIFFHSQEQRQLAEASVQKQREAGRNVQTTIDDMATTRFWNAEGYHQKYLLQHDREMMRAVDLDPEDDPEVEGEDNEFLQSTIAATVNGFVAGYGTRDGLEREITGEGTLASLSDRGKQRLRFVVARKNKNKSKNPR